MSLMSFSDSYLMQTWLMLRSITLKFEKWFSWMCLISCNTFQKHLLSQRENLIFWPQKWIFEISEAVFDSFWHPSMRKWHCKATLKVSKKILRPSIKNRLDTFVANVLEINLIPFSWSYDQNWLRETLKTEKKAKTPARSTFWNNRLQMNEVISNP